MHIESSSRAGPFPEALQRFVDAHKQKSDGFDDAFHQIYQGKKKGCWIWWILPRVAGEVRHHTGDEDDGSPSSRHFALDGLREAIAFLDHSVLGKNYFACVRAIRDQIEPSGPKGGQGRTLNEIFGKSDAKKVRCSVTLFRRAACWSSQLSDKSYRELVANCDAILVAASRDSHRPCEYVPKVCSSAEHSQEFLNERSKADINKATAQEFLAEFLDSTRQWRLNPLFDPEDEDAARWADMQPRPWIFESRDTFPSPDDLTVKVHYLTATLPQGRNENRMQAANVVEHSLLQFPDLVGIGDSDEVFERSRQDWLQNLPSEYDEEYDESIEDLGLPPTLVSLLEGNSIRGVAQIVASTEDELTAIRHLGPKKMAKIRTHLEQFGWRLGDIDTYVEGKDLLRKSLEEQARVNESKQREATRRVGPLVSAGRSVDEIVESTGLSERVVREARNAWMIGQRLAGATNQAIAEKVGMSAEGVRRSIKRAGGPDGEQVRKAWANGKKERSKDLKESIREIVIENPGKSLDKIAELVNVRPVEVRRNLTRLGTKLVLGLGRRQSKAKPWQDEQLLQVLKEASTKSTPLTTVSYNALVAQSRIEGPTAKILCRQFGSWRKACKAAGVQYGELRRNHTPGWPKAELEKFVVDFLESPEHDGMFGDFESWVRAMRKDDQNNAPSVPTFRNRLGHWDSMKQTAIETIIDTERINELRDLCE